MDLGLKELGITLMVGAFFILGLEAIMHYFFNTQLTGFFQDVLKSRAVSRATHADEQIGHEDIAATGSNQQKEHTASVVLFIAASFAVGIIAEDLSFKYVDSSGLPVKTIPAKVLPKSIINLAGLPTEDDDRVATLIADMSDPRPSPLIRDLAANDAFLISDRKGIGQKFQNWIKEPHCRPGDPVDKCPTVDEVNGAIQSLYYHAKNTVYDNPHYYDELRRIQARLEFTRSLSLIGLFFFILAVLSAVVLLLKQILTPRKDDEFQTSSRNLRARVPVFLALLFGVYFFCLWAYARETDAFNKRAFGYFSTMLIADRQAERQRLREKLAPSYQPPDPDKTPSDQTPATDKTSATMARSR